MAVTRQTIIREPGLVQFNSQYFYAKDGITVTQEDSPLIITAENFGEVDERVSDRMFRITFTPVGEWEALSTLFPYFATLHGAEVFGSSDVPLTIWTEGGRKYIFSAAAVTKMPTVKPTVGDTLLGEVEFTAILANGADPTDSGAYYTLSTGQTYPADAALSAANILTLAPSLAWGSSPWDDFEAEGGIEFTFNLTLSPKVTDRGTIGMSFAGLVCEAVCKPVLDAAMSDVLTAVNAGSALGAAKTKNDLVASYSGFYVSLNAAIMSQDTFRFSSSDNLINGVRFRATRSFTDGEPDALAYVGTSAPA